MKKLIALFLTSLCLFCLVACGEQQQEDEQNGQDYFTATILEICDTYVLVECADETSGAVSTGTTVKVSTDVIAAKGTPEMSIGDSVRVVFNGVKETDPASLETVYAIYLLDENGEAIDLE